jgi:hypothetical protein
MAQEPTINQGKTFRRDFKPRKVVVELEWILTNQKNG